MPARVHVRSSPSFIAFLIVGVAVLTGVELQYNGSNDDVTTLVAVTTMLTNIIFTMEVVLKLAAEGTAWTHVGQGQGLGGYRGGQGW